MRKTAVARWPGPSHGLVFRSPRRKVAVTVAPRVERATIFPEQGRPAFQTTASACVRSRITTGPWTTSAPGAKRSAAPWLSPALRALLQARTTLSGDAFPPPQPPSRARRRAVASQERTTLPTIVRAWMDFALSDDQREIQALAREVAKEKIEPHAAEWDREHRFPRELFTELAELGLMGVCVPEEYGGAGADFASYILVLEELSRADAGVGVTVAVHTSAATLPILTFGTGEQRSRFVPPLARGEAIGAFALTESGSGSDAGSLRTRAEPSDDGWRITGSKQWITNGTYAGTFLFFARTDPTTPGARGVSAFLVDADHVRVTRDE